jgi:hypothetical protein
VRVCIYNKCQKPIRLALMGAGAVMIYGTVAHAQLAAPPPSQVAPPMLAPAQSMPPSVQFPRYPTKKSSMLPKYHKSKKSTRQ